MASRPALFAIAAAASALLLSRRRTPSPAPVVRNPSATGEEEGVRYNLYEDSDGWLVEIRDEIRSKLKTQEDAQAYARHRIHAEAEGWTSSPSSREPSPGPEDANLIRVYSRKPTPPTDGLLQSIGPGAKAVLDGQWLHLVPGAQGLVYESARRQMVSSRRSAPSEVARRSLLEIAPSEDWSDMAPGGAPDLAWRSACLLARAAASQVGHRPGARGSIIRPRPDRGVVVGRAWLGLPERDANLPLGSVVEILVAEDDPMAWFAETIKAVVVRTDAVSGAPEAVVLDRLRGVDVAPTRTARHGYRPGDMVRLRARAPTGVRRILADRID